MAKKNDSAAGCSILIILIGVAYIWSKGGFWIAVPVIVLAVALIGIAAKPRRCQICGNPIKKDSHTWEIEGKRKVVCPKCNQAIERRNSKAAVANLLGKH